MQHILMCLAFGGRQDGLLILRTAIAAGVMAGKSAVKPRPAASGYILIGPWRQRRYCNVHRLHVSGHAWLAVGWTPTLGYVLSLTGGD